jgi:hypothetical protein
LNDLELETLIEETGLLQKHLDKIKMLGYEAITSDIALLLVHLNDVINYFKGKKRAANISQELHFVDPNADQIRMDLLDRVLAAEPIDSWTLVALIGLEREKTKSKVEIEVDRRISRARSETTQLGHLKRDYAKVKPDILKFYENEACDKLPNGKPKFKTKAAFIRAVLEKEEWRDYVQDDNTIAKWIKESTVPVPPHWKTRAKKK